MEYASNLTDSYSRCGWGYFLFFLNENLISSTSTPLAYNNMTTETVQYYFENWQTYWPFIDQKIIAISGYPYCILEIDHYHYGPDILSKVSFDNTWMFCLMTNADPKAMLDEIAKYVKLQKESA